MGLVGDVLLALTELDQRLPTSLIIFTGAATHLQYIIAFMEAVAL